MPPPASQTRVRPRSVACHGWGVSRCSPCMLPAICASRDAVGACVAAGWQGCVSRQGRWDSSCAGHAATGPMMTAATADASAVRSAGPYCLSPVVSRARCLQAAVQATAPQFVQSGLAPSAPLLPLCCSVVAVSSGGPCCSASGPCPGERAGGTGCKKLCAPQRSGCMWYGFCRQCSGAARGRKRSRCRYQWPCAADSGQMSSSAWKTIQGDLKIVRVEWVRCPGALWAALPLLL